MRARGPRRWLTASFLALLAALWALPTHAEPALRKIGEMELSLLGLSASVDPEAPVVPKNVASAVRVLVRAGARELTASEVADFLGAGFEVRAELSGPGLTATLSLPDRAPGEPLPADPFLLHFPPLPTSGDYTLANVRIESGGRTVLDAQPSNVPLKVIERVLVTSVKTRPLTLDEIVERGIDLADAENYLGFGFTLGLKLESEVVQIKFPVIFDRKGAVVPDPLKPPPAPPRVSGPVQLTRMPQLVPLLLEAEGGGPESPPLELALPSGAPVTIPGLLVIPGDIGYLKQFFSAQLFVANGAPVGSGLVVSEVEGTIELPLGPDGIRGPDPSSGVNDDPLSLPDLVRDGETQPQPETLPVRGTGPDETAGTADDVDTFAPGEQGLADFTIRGDAEGFHPIAFDIRAALDGLPVGRVNLKGRAAGGVLVRNPYFDLTFTAPSVVRTDENFKLYVTVTNVGQGTANLLKVSIDHEALSGAQLVSDAEQNVPVLKPGDAKTFEYEFLSQRTGQVVASYLRFDAGADVTSGSLKFKLSVGERGVPLSPDTLVLPASLDPLPDSVVRAAMRVLGQAWSVANAPSLPTDVLPIDRSVVQKKALALAEAGLRTTLGQDALDAVRDLAWDFFSGTPAPDPGFDQLLRKTEAGRGLVLALGGELGPRALSGPGGPLDYERDWARLLASGPDFVTFAVADGSAAPAVDVALVDDAGRRTASSVPPLAIPGAEVPGVALIPMGGAEPAPIVGLLTSPVSSFYELELYARDAGPVDLAVTLPRGDGTVFRGTASATLQPGGRGRVPLDLARPTSLVLEIDSDGDGLFESSEPILEDSGVRDPEGPDLVSAQVIGPEVLPGASPFGVYAALLFDRVVDEATAAQASRYSVPANEVRAARRQLSGRLVFVSLAQPEGPYVPTEITVDGMADERLAVRPGPATVDLGSLLADPGGIVTGRVITAEGDPVTGGFITYMNQTGSLASCEGATSIGLSQQDLEDGRYELRYVRRSPCGPFQIVTQDPTTGAKRQVTGRVRTAGERIVLDIALLGRGTVTGTVRRFTGPGSVDTVPAPGVRVAAYSVDDRQSFGAAVTDGDGRYVIDDLTVGPVNVRAGGATGVGSGFGRIERPGTPAVVDILLDSDAARIHGTVKAYEAGHLAPVPGIQVLYFLGSALLGATNTNAAGEYAFESVPTGEFSIRASLNTRDRVRVDGTAGVGDDKEVDLVFEVPDPAELGTVHGRVVFPDGSPVVGAVVSVGQVGAASVDVNDPRYPGAPAGYFEITDIPVRAFVAQRVNAYTPDGLRTGSRQFTFTDAPGPVVNVGDIALSGLGEAHFVVEDHAGSRLSGQLVLLQGSCRNPCGCVSATTGPTGEVAFYDLPVGLHRARAFRSGGAVMDIASATAVVPGDGRPGQGTLIFPGTGTIEVTAFEPVPGGGLQPVHGAEVALRSKVYINDGLIDCGLFPGESHRGRTDQDGKITFTDVNAGSVSVSVYHPIFARTAGRNGNLAGGDTQSFVVEFADTIAGELSGTVFLPDGETPSGAGVEVTVTGPLPDVTVRTNAESRYRFAEILPAGTWTLTASDPQTAGLMQTKIVLQAGQAATHDVRLKGRGTVKVRVVDGAGQPVDVASVRLRETEYPDRLQEGILDDSTEGVVTFRGVYEGPLSVEASDPFGRGGRISGILPRPDDTVELTVRLTTTGTVGGVFRMPPVGPDPGDPIPFGTVKVLSSGRVIGQQTTVGNGTDRGRFSFDYVPAGPIRLEALDPLTGRTGFSVGTLVNQNDVLEIDVVAQALGTVFGTVTANAVPEPRAEVQVVSGTYRANAFADKNGVYRVEGVPAGRVIVTASRPGGFLKGTNEDTLTEEGQPLEIPVALRDTGRIDGVVSEAGGGTPAPLSVVTVTVGGTGGGRQTTTTDEVTGEFTFDEVPSGAATLTVDVVGSIDQAQTTVQVPPQGSVPVTIMLNGVGSIDGVTSGVPGGYSQRVTLTGTGTFPWNRTLIPDALGEFRLPEVLAGPFTARLLAQSGALHLYGNLQDEVRPGEQASILLELQPTGRVEGAVFRSDGAPAYGAEVVVKTPNGNVTTQADTAGDFALDGVPAAAVTIDVSDLFSGGIGRASGTVPEAGVLALGRIDLDDTPIAVVSVDPPHGVVGVLLDRTVTVTFTDPVGSAHQNTVFVSDGTRGLSLSPVVAPDGLSLTLSPAVGLWPDAHELFVTVTTGITDVFGRHPLASFTSSFHTVDHSPPQILSVVPAAGAIQVPDNAVVVVTFDEPLATTLDPTGLVTLVRSGGSSVPGVVSLSADRREATFTPAALLAPNARYDVTVDGAVDESGNPQPTPFPSSFTTVDTIPPVLTALAPAPGGWTSSAQPEVRLGVSDAVPGSGVNPLAGTEAMTLDGNTVTPLWVGDQLRFTPPAALAEGPHTVDASVTDRAGNVGVLAPFPFSVDITPPAAATVTNPMDGLVRGSITVTAAATDVPTGPGNVLSGVVEIQVFLDGAGSPLVVLQEPFAWPWDTTTATEGTHTLTARAIDRAGNLGPIGPPVGILIDNDPLTVDVLSPSAGSRFRDTVTVRARTSEPAARVEFSIEAQSVDGSLVADRTYEATLDLTGIPSGDVTVSATAHGLQTEQASATVGITVDHDPPARPVDLLITAQESDPGFATVQGQPSAVEGRATVVVTNPAGGDEVSATATVHGSFTARLRALRDDVLTVVAIDEVGNESPPATVVVTERTNEDGVPLEGLALWVSANYGVTVDPLGGVEAWADRSTSGRDLSQATETKRPEFVDEGFKDWPVLRFDGVDDSIEFARLTTIRTVFWVVSESPDAGEGARTLLGDNLYDYFRGGFGDPGTIWSSTTSAGVKDGQTWVNGEPKDGTATPRPRQMSIVTLITTSRVYASRFGQSRDVTPWHGDLAELIIYDRPLTPAERQSVEDHLARKYEPYAPTAGTPGIAPAGGAFTVSTTVQLTSTTPTAEIRFTLDGSEPTRSSELYLAPFVLTETTTVTARAFLSGYADSATATATFIRRDQSPVLAPGAPVLWLRADAGIATNAGAWVTEWADQSGQGNDAFQDKGAFVPRLVPNELNGLPVIHFDGSDDWVSFTSRVTTIRTVFWVVKESTSAGEGERSLLGDNLYDYFRGGFGDPGPIWHDIVNSAVRDGQTWVDGVPVDGRTELRPRKMSVVSLVTQSNVYANRFGLARNVTPWHGDLAELIIYDRPLTAEERRRVQDHLLARYETTGTVTAPFISPPGGVFDVSTEVTVSTQTPEAEIRYTLDGTEPTTTSQRYTGAIRLTETTTLKAKAFKDPLTPSATAVAGFTLRADAVPLSVPNLQLWWRADVGVPSGAGDRWEDQSGLGNHGVQAFGGATPRLEPNAVNGLPAMRFDGSDDWVSFTSRITTIRTVFWVVKESTSAGEGQRGLLGDNLYDYFRGGPGDPGPIWHDIVNPAVRDGQTWVDGVPVDGRTELRPRKMSVVSLVTQSNVYANRFGLARNVTPWHGDLAELLIYDRPLTAEERRRVENHLLARYETTGAVTTPFVSPPGGVFDVSVDVAVSTQTPEAEIRYTLDGTEPTTASQLYTGPIPLTATTTLKAKAFKDPLAPSATAVAGFTLRADAVPLSIPNLQLWWRADAGVPSGAGDHWEDQSGLANHGRQAFSGATPRLEPNVVNGLPAMRFDGADDSVSFPARLTTIRTVFWVVKESTLAGAGARSLLGDNVYDYFRGGSGDPGPIWAPEASGAVRGGDTRVNGADVVGTSEPRPRAMSIVLLATTSNVYANRFGQARNVTPWHGSLAELLIYDRRLDAAEVETVEDYLNAKYGIFIR